MPRKPGDPLSSSTVALVRVSDHLPHTWSEEVLIERWTVKQTGALIPALYASPKSYRRPDRQKFSLDFQTGCLPE